MLNEIPVLKYLSENVLVIEGEPGRPRLIKHSLYKTKLHWCLKNHELNKFKYIKISPNEPFSDLFSFLSQTAAYDDYCLPRTKSPIDYDRIARNILRNPTNHITLWIPANRLALVSDTWDINKASNSGYAGQINGISDIPTFTESVEREEVVSKDNKFGLSFPQEQNKKDLIYFYEKMIENIKKTIKEDLGNEIELKNYESKINERDKDLTIIINVRQKYKNEFEDLGK